VLVRVPVPLLCARCNTAFTHSAVCGMASVGAHPPFLAKPRYASGSWSLLLRTQPPHLCATASPRVRRDQIPIPLLNGLYLQQPCTLLKPRLCLCMCCRRSACHIDVRMYGTHCTVESSARVCLYVVRMLASLAIQVERLSTRYIQYLWQGREPSGARLVYVGRRQWQVTVAGCAPPA
jgi:hypothetical protein